MFRSSVAAVFRRPAPAPIPATVTAPASVIEIHRSRVQVRQVRAEDRRWLPELADLLVDGVHHGASLGFLAPMSRHAALDYWEQVYASLGPKQALWIALESDDGPLQGCLQFTGCAQAHHRGELRQLMVHSRSRGRGIATQLLNRAECTVRDLGRTLLVLETPADSQAEAVFAHLDWQRAGEIPDFSACAEGRLHASAMYYKRLELASS
ncbi:GNAT family N-acetyltransferase [Paucibacter sp. R3-3]|uniref:GNAT family N-acetyltransferase n=1 Tax=Roseateles agri TaxID=3098619 RepID=A0ABU5DDE9_9BURK|nr:GNAT family N-acetyltransferase [Paucibacter sp. R3-3]MDY0743202.1 GNAT family N-acetyltransferase [Paucibacter sp. R3-3]